MNEMRGKVSKYLNPCPKCGKMPGLYEETFYGSSIPTFTVECTRCELTTKRLQKPRSAIIFWNNGRIKKKRKHDAEHIDNDGLINLMSHIMAQTVKDYRWYASKVNPTKIDMTCMRRLEEFVMENPYMLPYDSKFVLKKMKPKVWKTRKKHAS